jgi:chaperonin GroES
MMEDEALSPAIEDEGLEADDAPEQPRGLDFLQNAIGHPNLAEDLDASELASIGAKVVDEYGIDLASRSAEGWDERYDAAMKLALQAREEKSYPWPKAANIKFPLISTAAIQFNARAYPAIVDGPNIVKGQVLGRPTPEKAERADRIGKHMSYQLLQEMDDWEDDTDRLLIMLPIVGCAFRKSYFDPMKGYNCSHLVSAKHFVVNYWTKDLDTCPRATHVLEFYPHEVAEKMRSGVWRTVEIGQAPEASNDDQAPHQFLEQCRLLDLDEDDYPEPYIVTVHRETNQVVRIVARFDETGVEVDGDKVIRIQPLKLFTKYGFIPSPDGSFYDLGFGTLLNPLSETINTTINQLMDAGHLSNVQGGFISSGVSIKSGALRFQPGEWKRAESTGGALKDGIVPLPVREPSAVMMSLLMFLIEAAKDVTATQDIMTGETGQSNQPVGTTLAAIEQGLKTFTAIVKRIHRALKHELGILYYLNSRFLNPQAYFTFQDQEGVVAQQDYAEGDVDVVPVSDPSMATDMQKMGRAQFLMSMRGQGLNDVEINKRALEAAAIPDIDKLLPQGPPPKDPALEIKEREVAAKELTAHAGAAVDAANAQKTTLEAVMMAPAFQEQVAQLVVQLAAQMAGPANGPQVQPGPVPGMEAGAGQPGILSVPQGPAGPVGPPMGLGEPDGPDPAMQGPPPGGVGQPGMG